MTDKIDNEQDVHDLTPPELEDASGGLAKVGGTTALAIQNDYTGTTTVVGGTLMVKG